MSKTRMKEKNKQTNGRMKKKNIHNGANQCRCKRASERNQGIKTQWTKTEISLFFKRGGLSFHPSVLTHQTLPGVRDGRHVHRLSLHRVNETSLGHSDGAHHMNPPADGTPNTRLIRSMSRCRVASHNWHAIWEKQSLRYQTCHLWFSSKLLLLNCTNSRPATVNNTNEHNNEQNASAQQ